MEETISFTALWALLISINHTKGVNFPIKDSGTPRMRNQQVHKHIHTHSGHICLSRCTAPFEIAHNKLYKALSKKIVFFVNTNIK